MAVRHGHPAGAFVAAAMAAQEFFGETPLLGCEDLPSLWTGLTRRQTRSMVERVEGNTATVGEKFGYRLDLFRMTESPAHAARLLVSTADDGIRRRRLRRPVNPELLISSR